MKNIFILKPNNKFGRGVIRNVYELRNAINENEIQNYFKIPFVEEGDILVCCEKDLSFIPNAEDYTSSGNGDGAGGAGYQEDLIFKVNEIASFNRDLIFFGAKGYYGVYADRVRLATPEEIEIYNQQNEK